MPDPYSPASASSTTASASPESSMPGSASPTLGGERSCLCDGPECRSTTTCERWMAVRLASIFLSGDSPAREPAQPESERASTIQRLLCGERWLEFLASYDPASRCWRTSQTSLLSETGRRGERFSGTWPRSGMCAHGTVYPLPPLAPRTSATECSPLLPTPANQDGKNATAPSQADRKSPPLTHALLPTPSATEYGSNQSPSQGAAVRPILKGALLPTPRGSDGAGSSSHNRTWSATDFNLHTWSRGLPIGASTAPPSAGGKRSPAPLLNPSFVEWMLGAPAGWSDPDCRLSATEFRCSAGSSSEGG